MYDLATLKANYAEASKAYHQLLIGGSVRVYVDQNAERVEYSAANKAGLWAYLMQLRGMICQLEPNNPICTLAIGQASGPMRVVF